MAMVPGVGWWQRSLYEKSDRSDADDSDSPNNSQQAKRRLRLKDCYHVLLCAEDAARLKMPADRWV